MSLTPDPKALLRVARDAHEPTAEDRARVRAALAVQIGTVSGLGTAGAMAARRTGATKVIAAFAIAGAIGGIAAVAGHWARVERAPTKPVVTSPMPVQTAPLPSATAIPTAASDSTPIRAATTEAPSIPPSPPRVAAAASAHHNEARRVLHASAPPAAPGASEAPPAIASSDTSPLSTRAPTTLDEELRLVRGGVAALDAGNPSLALSLLNEHARRFANGLLAEERAAERVAALCALGRVDEARSDAAIFLRDRTQSPLAAKIRASCAHAPPGP